MQTDHALTQANDCLPDDKHPKTSNCSRLQHHIARPASLISVTDIGSLISASPEEVHFTSYHQWTALHMICVCADSTNITSLIKVAHILIRAGIDVNAQDTTSHTALMRLACVLAWYPLDIDILIELFSLLMASSCAVNLKNSEGLTALHLYYYMGGRDSRVAQAILDVGFNIESKSNEGNTVLMVLMKLCWRSVPYQTKQNIRILLDGGANIDAQDNEGNTVLHVVADHGDSPVRLLLEQGANPNIRNNKGKTPIMCCHDRMIEHQGTIRLLQQAGATDQPYRYRTCSIM